MVRKHLKLYLFLLVTAVITFFLFGEQLLRTQMPDSKPPLIRIPLNKINYTAHQYEIKYAEPIFQIRGIVVGTVLKSADGAKPKILGLANKLIEGLKVEDSSDKLTLAVFDMFGVFQDLESNMVEDEKRIKLLIYPMNKSYDPCLVLTKDEWKSSGWQKLLNSRLLSLYTADFIHEIKKSFGDNQGTYLHLLYNDIDLKDDWNEMLPLEEAKATIANSDNHIAGFVIPPSDLEEIESSIRQNALSGSSVKDTLLEEIDGPSSTVDIVKGAVTEDVLLVPIDRDFHDCETHVPIPWPLPSFIQHNKANRDTRVIIPETLAFLVEEDLTLPKWFYDALGIQFQQILTVQSIPQAENEDLNALPKLSYIAFNINNDKDTIPYGDNEEYIISMSANNYTIDITAPSMVGALRAIQSLGQLVRQGRGYNYIPNFPITIKDRPKFPHRGLLMDTAREYYNTSTIKSIIQFLGANKMNVLHWHITDDHAFSIESKKYPGLAKGSTFGGPFYTQEEVKEIVDLAKLHGVRVIAEIGGPAHAGSWINEHHRDMIANCPKFSCKKAWGVTMNPTLDKTYNMLQDFFNEISALFPDPYMHFGGDEATPECWSQDANVVSWMKANDMKTDYNKLMQHFETKFHDIASSIKRIGMRWEEVWSRPGSKLDWPIVVAWISKPTEGWMTPLIRDYNVSFLSYNGWYLNHNAGGVGCQTWSECYDTKIFELDPNSKLWSRALGGCASAWEMSDAHFTGRDLWLRTSTLSEPLWTAESVVAENRQQKNQKVLPRLLEMCRYLMSTQFSSEVYKTRHPCWHLSQDYLGDKHQEIKNQLLKEYSIREAQRDDLICTRVKNHFNPSDKTSLTCSTKNCIRENIGTTHHETKG